MSLGKLKNGMKTYCTVDSVVKESKGYQKSPDNKKEAIEILKTHSAFWSKLGFPCLYLPPRLDENGNPIVLPDDFDSIAYHRAFAAAGVKIHTSCLFSGWIGVERYDYQLTDKTLDALLKNNPDIFYIPRINLNVPLDWSKKNPEELFVYFNGPRDREAIQQLVGTDKHDLLGYDSSEGLYTAGGWKDDRPNVGGVISNQSFSSKKWLQDAGEALRLLIHHLEQGPYGKQIIAYQITYGISGETCVWGRFAKSSIGDWGIVNRKAFFDWGMMRYGSIETLRAAWNRPELTRDNAESPVPAQRVGASDSLLTLMRGDTKDKICIDYDLFTTDVNIDAIEHFGHIVKECTEGKPVGFFYGYILECDNAAYSGWLGYNRILKSPYVDFLAAPKSYYRNGPGEPGGLIAPAQSINRKKLWMDEIDIRTHLSQTKDGFCQSQCFEDSRSMLWREFAKNLAANSGFWWMDLGGGWFNSPEIMGEITTMEKIVVELKKHPQKSIAQTLILVDENSYAHLKCGTPIHRLLLMDTLREFNLTGSPVDLYRLSDLEDMDLSQYRLIVFLNTFIMDPRYLKRIPRDATVLWNYAPGVINNGRFSLENIRNLIGFGVSERIPSREIVFCPKGPLSGTKSCQWKAADHESALPHLEIIPDKELTVWARYADNSIAMALKERNVYCTVPILKAEHLRAVMAFAGCHLYAPCGTVVYGDNRFLAVFNDEAGNFELHLPKPIDISNAVSGQLWTTADTIPLSLSKHSMCFLTFNQ